MPDTNGPVIPAPDFSVEDKFLKGLQHLADDNGQAAEGTSEPLPFPVDAFPPTIQKIINATNASLQFPVDFMGSAILFAASVAIGNSVRIRVKEGWDETALIYIANVGRAGTTKTHPLTFALKPIAIRDAANHREYLRQKEAYETAVTLSKKDREELGISPETPSKPYYVKHLVSDITPEALGVVHSHNLRGLGLHADELAGWFGNFNRYHKGSEETFWLQNWSNQQVRIDRKSGDPILISCPFVSVAGNIQNGILKELAKSNRTQNGFIDRILFAAPLNLTKAKWTRVSLDPEIPGLWASIINRLFCLPLYQDDNGEPIAKVVTFTSEAFSILEQWQHKNADICNSTENEIMASIYSKLDIHVIRIALIIYLLECADNAVEPDQIPEDTVKAAIRLIEYFRLSAHRVQELITAKPIDGLPEDKRRVYSELPKEFTTEEAVTIGISLNMPERTIKRFLKDSRFFRHMKHGQYEKRYY
jgi:hypothetical protein